MIDMSQKYQTYRLSLSLVVALLAGSNSTYASTFSYGTYGVVNDQTIQITSPVNESGGSGQIDLYLGSSQSGPYLPAWCLDVYTFLAGSGTYTVAPLTTSGSGGSNPLLSTAQIGEIGALVANGNAIINTGYNVSSAIQLAIWQVEYGSQWASNGVNSTVQALANTYEGYVTGSDPKWAPDNNVLLLSTYGNQSLGSNQSLISATPLPAALPLFATGLGALGLFGWRKKRKAAAQVAA
jgi:hypothetical protein